MTFYREDIATIVAGGKRYEDWDTVFVQQREGESYPIFRFTAVERDPDPDQGVLARLQFVPGDEVAIYLGGWLAISGVITVRQTAYDANSHGVMLQGVGITWYAARASILDKDGNYDGKTYQQIAQKVITPFGIGVEIVGKLDEEPFQHAQVQPGETVWNFLERLARPKGIVVSNDHKGNFRLIGDHTSPVVAQIIEGQNILKCQATLTQEYRYNPVNVRGQNGGDDKENMAKVAEMEATVAGHLKRYSPILVAAEDAWSQSDIVKRAQSEAKWNAATDIVVNVTLRGWMMPNGGLWRAKDVVFFYSPMTVLKMNLIIKTVTFTQDSQSGTLTQLELIAPWGLNNQVVNPGDPSPRANKATANEKPTATPAAAKVPEPYPERLSSA